MPPDPAAEPAPPPWGGQIGERLWAVANVVAPTTVATTLLFYFGYVATSARFRYFGVYLDMVDLSLQETLLYGVEAVYPPLIIVAIVGLLAVSVHLAVRWAMSSPDRDAATGWAGAFAVLAGLPAFARGVVGLLTPQVARTEAIATTPVSLGCGAAGIAYGLWLLRVVGIRWDRRRSRLGGTTADPPEKPPEEPAEEPLEEPPGETSGKPAEGASEEPVPPPPGGDLAAWLESPAFRRISRYALAWVAVVVVAGSFWTVNSFAAAYGRGRALDDAESLRRRPEVVLYTTVPLRDLPTGVRGTRIAAAKGEKGFHRFRYRGLRLLVESNARLFLVPARWVAGSSHTLVVPYDGTVRVHLIAH
ncbi:hypothetical protein GCM10017673_04330 [Streptosporangium violaceochromogenes]|nr:hypothetical protein GCM10017673_04330 [Streptosporangium violaceochromogenes]